MEISGLYGSTSFADVTPRKRVPQAFSTRLTMALAGQVASTVTVEDRGVDIAVDLENVGEAESFLTADLFL